MPNKSGREAALLAAIYASPDDDLPRLVFADWCDENGQPERAEFIRTEIEIARIAPGGDGTQSLKNNSTYCSLLRRANDLWETHKESWYPKLLIGRYDRCESRRGFPHTVCLTAQQFRERGEVLFRLAPTIHTVRLEDANQAVVALSRCSALSRVRQLEPEFHQDTAAAAFFRSKHLSGLRVLSLWQSNIGPEAVSAIANSPSLTGLEKLDLTTRCVGDQLMTRLIRQTNFRTLQSLEAGGNQLTDEFAHALADAGHLTRLCHINLSQNDLTTTGVVRLCAAKHLSGLERLNLSHNPLGLAAADHLATATFADTFQRLELTQCELGKDGTARLFAAPFRHLSELVLVGNAVSITSARALLDNCEMGSLVKLVLRKCRILPATIAVLARAKNLHALRSLHLGDPPLSDGSVRTVVNGALAQSLETLDLGETWITDAGAKAIAEAELPNLQALLLSSHRLTEAGVRAVVESKTLNGLRFFSVGALRLSESIRSMLRTRFGDGGFH